MTKKYKIKFNKDTIDIEKGLVEIDEEDIYNLSIYNTPKLLIIKNENSNFIPTPFNGHNIRYLHKQDYSIVFTKFSSNNCQIFNISNFYRLLLYHHITRTKKWANSLQKDLIDIYFLVKQRRMLIDIDKQWLSEVNYLFQPSEIVCSMEYKSTYNVNTTMVTMIIDLVDYIKRVKPELIKEDEKKSTIIP